jgi:hypothetical protein
MVLEAFVAIGLAANVVQFVSFSATLISGTHQAYHSASGLTEEYVDLDYISSSVIELRDSISDSSNGDSKLDDLVDRSVSIAQELLEAIDKLRSPPAGTKRKRWKSFAKALMTVWKTPQLAQLEARLEKLRDHLTFHLVCFTSDQQLHLVKLLENWQSQNLQTQAQTTFQLEVIQKCFAGRQDETFWSGLHHFSEASKKVETVTKTFTILESLRYDSMEVRHASIIDAHRKTFEWIFDTGASPQNSPHSAVKFSSWLQEGTGIYWVTGKPGSGKSTLMKYLDDHPTTEQHLKRWAAGASLVKANFYFWNPGTEMQKSLLGLLQSLLFRVLMACPDLIPILCPQRWNEPVVKPIPTWSVSELRDALARLKGLYSVKKTMFYFHMDGLDEFVGDSWEVIGILKELSLSPNVKLCLSSRPWNCFNDAFGQSNSQMLQLHQLTASDIKLFARDGLSAYSTYQEHINQALFDNLIDDICERAQGVFLWVRLVVRSLKDGLVNDDPVALLKSRLHALPTDLEDFFEHIIKSVDTVYQERMARTFLAALMAAEPMKIIHYAFLEEEHASFGLELDFEPFTKSQLQRRVLQAQRRLNGRYKGLLEPSNISLLSPDTSVDFLHRSLHDFLKTDKMRMMLESRAPGHLHIFSDITRAHLAATKYTMKTLSPRDFKSTIHEASSLAQKTGNVLHEYEALDHVELVLSQYMESNHPKYPKDLMAVIATHIGRVDYLKHRLKRGGMTIDLDWLLVQSMLSTSIGNDTFAIALSNNDYQYSSMALEQHVSRVVDPCLVEFLLQNGANPNMVVNGRNLWHVLAQDILRCFATPEYSKLWKLFQAFVRHGADVTNPIDIWADILKDMRFCEKDSKNTLKLFQLLFSHGLNPLAQSRGMSLWEFCLNKAKNRNLALSTDHDLLREFFKYGASLRQIYTTLSESWFDHFLKRLREGIWNERHTLIEVFDILLAHGLDPNLAYTPGVTMWKQILDDVIDFFASDRARPHAYFRMICILFMQCLRYRADPHCESLDIVLDWLDWHSSLIRPSLFQELEDLKKLVHAEREDRKLQALAKRPVYRGEPSRKFNRTTHSEATGSETRKREVRPMYLDEADSRSKKMCSG